MCTWTGGGAPPAGVGLGERTGANERESARVAEGKRHPTRPGRRGQRRGQGKAARGPGGEPAANEKAYIHTSSYRNRI